MAETVAEKAQAKAKAVAQETMPEAVASVTYNLKTKKGYPILFTMRGADEDKLLDRMTAIEMQFEKLGMQPDIRSYGGGGAKKAEDKKYVEGKVCPKCGGKVLDITTKNGKRLHQCENRKYDFTTKTTSGCDFMEWQDDVATSEETPSEGQKKVLEAKGLWVAGMTKAEANELIAGLRS